MNRKYSINYRLNHLIVIFFIIIIIGFNSISCEKNIKYPFTRIETVVDTIHSVAFEDPYRWLEDRYSLETLDWIKKQNEYISVGIKLSLIPLI